MQPRISNLILPLLALLLIPLCYSCSSDEPKRIIGGCLVAPADCPYYLNLHFTDKQGNNLVEGIDARYVSTRLLPDEFLSDLLLTIKVDSIPYISSDLISITEQFGKDEMYKNAPVFLTHDSLGCEMVSVYRTRLLYDIHDPDFIKDGYILSHYLPTYEIKLRSWKIFGDYNVHTVRSDWSLLNEKFENICKSVTFDGKKCAFVLTSQFNESTHNITNFYDVTIVVDR